MKSSHLILIAITFSVFVTGAIESMVSLEDAASIAFVHLFVLAVLNFMWCKRHISEHEILKPGGSAASIGLLGPIAVPFYFYRMFSFKTASLKLMMFVLFLLLQILVFGLSAFAVQAITK